MPALFPMQKPQTDPLFYSSLVIEHIVPKGRDRIFKRWLRSLIKTARQQEGFLRSDSCPPLLCQNDAVKWYSIFHFDTPAHLNDWIESDGRKQAMKSGQGIFRAYRFKSFTTGLEGWFSSRSRNEHSRLGPPPWKQILSVVLGLYPVIMVQSQLFKHFGIMQTWPLAIAMPINNLITSTILTLVVMPFVARRLSFWLRPAYRLSPVQTELSGLAVFAAAMLMMVVIFNHF